MDHDKWLEASYTLCRAGDVRQVSSMTSGSSSAMLRTLEGRGEKIRPSCLPERSAPGRLDRSQGKPGQGRRSRTQTHGGEGQGGEAGGENWGLGPPALATWCLCTGQGENRASYFPTLVRNACQQQSHTESATKIRWPTLGGGAGLLRPQGLLGERNFARTVGGRPSPACRMVAILTGSPFSP